MNRGSSLAEHFSPKPTDIVFCFSSSSFNLKIKRILINSMKHQIQQQQKRISNVIKLRICNLYQQAKINGK